MTEIRFVRHATAGTLSALVALAASDRSFAADRDPEGIVASGSFVFDGLNLRTATLSGIGGAIGYRLREHVTVGASVLVVSGTLSDDRCGVEPCVRGFTEGGPFAEFAGTDGHLRAYVRAAPMLFAYAGERSLPAGLAGDHDGIHAALKAELGFDVEWRHFGIGPFAYLRAATGPKPLWCGIGVRINVIL